MTRVFNLEEQQDRNQVTATIGTTPSPRGISWMLYIQHRLRLMENGIETYTVKSYARLQLDKHIEWHRAIDKMAGKLIRHKPSIIYFGSGQIAANCPIKIKKHVRCPGTRKFIASFLNRDNCIIRMVDEFNTSQHCAKCLKRFPARTKSYRFKTCYDCHPNPILCLPTLIATDVSKRILQIRRTIVKEWQRMRDAGDEIATLLFQRGTRRLVSKKITFLKTWVPNDVNDEMETHTTVWHRDIAAAKLILYRGMSKESFYRLYNWICN